MSLRLVLNITTIGLLWLAGLGAAGQFAKIAVPFPLLLSHYPNAEAYAGWLLSSLSALGVVLGMLAGAIVLRIGLIRCLIGALWLGALLSWLQATLPSFGTLLGLRMLEGLSHLAIAIAAPTLMTTIAAPKWHKAVMTLWSSFFGVAFALTAVFGMPFAQSHGIEALLTAHALWMAGIALALMGAFRLLHLPNLPRWTGKSAGFIALHRQAYGSARIASPAVGWLFYTATFVSGLAVLPPLIDPELRAPVVQAMPLLSIAVALIALPVFGKYISAVGLTILSFAASGVVAFLGAAGLSLVVTCLVLYAVLGAVQGGSFASVPELNPKLEDQALANGAMAQTGNIGNLLGAPLIGFASLQGGATLVLFSFGLLYLCGTCAHLWLARQRRKAG